MGRGHQSERAPLTLVPAPPRRLPVSVSGANDVWSAGRLLAGCWRLEGASAWDALEAAAARVDEVVRLRAATPEQAAARFRWLLSLELDEALMRSIGSEPDGDPAQSARMCGALISTASAWRRRQQTDGSSVSAVLEDAVDQVEALVAQWN